MNPKYIAGVTTGDPFMSYQGRLRAIVHLITFQEGKLGLLGTQTTI